MCNGHNHGYDCGCGGGIRRDCYGNVVSVPPPGLPQAPATCPTTNAQVFLASDKTWQKVQAHLVPKVDPTTITIGQSAIMVNSAIVSITDGLDCDDGHIAQVTATDPSKTVSVLVRLVAGGAQTVTLTGAGAFGVQGQNITFRWIKALNAYIIVESYTGPGTVQPRGYYVETHFDRLVPYTIQHNLNLANPDAYILEIRDAMTGDIIDLAVTAVTANSIRVTSGINELDVKIKVLAL